MTLFLFLAGFCAILISQSINTDDIYTGKITMSPVEYAKFKKTLESPSVKVKELIVIPDGDPYVQFTVAVPNGYTFPFGQKAEGGLWPVITLIIAIPLFLFAIAFTLFVDTPHE